MLRIRLPLMAALCALFLPALAHVTPARANTCTLITTVTQLQNMQQFGDYCLGANINAKATSTWNHGAGFVPISGFGGTLDGGGHTISFLTIARTNSTPSGLVATLIDNGIVRNLGLINESIAGRGNVGGIVGQITNGTLENSWSTGNIQYTGHGSTSCIAGGQVGGLVGCLLAGSVLESYSTANVVSNGADYAGGIVGFNLNGTIDEVYFGGQLNGSNGANVGGVVAFTQGTVENAYNIGSVTGGGGIGGGVAAFVNGGTILNVYNAGPVTASYETGAIIGALGSGTVTNSFWDVAYTGTLDGIGFVFGGTTANLAGYPDDQMMDQVNFSEFGWDFGQTWGIAEGSTYPFLLALTTRGVTVRGDYCATGGTSCVANGQGAGWTYADVEVQSLSGSSTRQPFHAYLQCRSVYSSGGNLYQDVGLVDTAASGGTLRGTMLLSGNNTVLSTTGSSTLSAVPNLPDPGQEFSDHATVTGVGLFNVVGNNGNGRMTAGLYRMSISGDIPSYIWDGSQWQLSQVKSNAHVSCTASPSINLLYDKGLSQATPNADAATIHA